jgi:hypothetical protein
MEQKAANDDLLFKFENVIAPKEYYEKELMFLKKFAAIKEEMDLETAKKLSVEEIIKSQKTPLFEKMIGDSGLLVLPKSASVTTDVCLF